MPARKPMINVTDAENLREIINNPWVQSIADQRVLRLLEERLEKAITVSDERLPCTVVAMQSTVRLKFPMSGDTETFQLVYPEDADIQAARLSVLAPVGVAILGRHRGQSTLTRVPTGSRRVTIVDVMQWDVRAATGNHRRL